MRESEDRTYLQCANCGNIYDVENRIPIDKLYIDSYCPICNYSRALNIGDSKDDKYLYYDPHMDEKFYIY